jgi:spore maturation protein CgeB
VGVFDEELEIAVPEAARNHSITVYWDVDAPATLESIEADLAHHLRRVIPRYDLVLTYGGGEPVVNAYRLRGARLCVPIYNALDPDTHYPVAGNAAFACDLGFLGNRLPDRERRVEEFLFKAAALLPERTFLLGGAGWETKALPPNVRLAGHVGTADHNTFFCSGLAALNINRDSMARFGFSPPTRVFEAAGTAACIITDAWRGVEYFLEPGTEILVAESGAATAELLRHLMRSEAEQIGQAARRRVLAEHTYSHRARQVSDLIESTFKREAAA